MMNSIPSSKPMIRLLNDTREAREEKLRRKAFRSFTTYKRVMYRRYQHALHLSELDRCLMEALRYVETGGKEGLGRLIVEMPP